MQPCEYMTDARHKKPPPDLVSEENTEAFRSEATQTLVLNRGYNKLRGLRYSDPGYRISSQAELAKALSERLDREVSRRMVQKILGGVREGTKIDLVEDSVYIPVIRELLGMARTVRISVKEGRAEAFRLMDGLPDDRFKVFENAVEDASRKEQKRR